MPYKFPLCAMYAGSGYKYCTRDIVFVNPYVHIPK
jgi:hypothetical protein